MNEPRRPRLLTVLALVVGIPLAIWLAALYLAARAARETVRGFGEVLSLAAYNAAAGLKSWSQLRAASDLVIERDQRGGYLLSGTLLPEGRRAATIVEVEEIVRRLPRKGAALVTVEESPTLLAPGTPESAARQAELEALVRREGFAIVRGSYKLPLLAGDRPTTR